MANPTRRTSWTGWVLTLLVPLLLMLGCSKKSWTTSPSDYGGDGASYGDEDASYGGGGEGYAQIESDADYAAKAEIAEDYSPAPAPAYRSGNRSSKRSESAKVGAPEQPPAPPTESASEPEPAPITVDVPELADQSTPKPKPDAQAAPSKRQIIYTATMQVSVYDVAHAISVAEALPDSLGGWLHQRLDNQLVLRIPAEQLDRALDLIAELGVVDYRLLEALDVTAQYTDLDSRIKILIEMQAQLEALLAQAKDVEQALQIRQALDKITLELELARGQMRELAKSIAFSTLILRFVERGPTAPIPTSNDPFGWVDQLGVETTEYR